MQKLMYYTITNLPDLKKINSLLDGLALSSYCAEISSLTFYVASRGDYHSHSSEDIFFYIFKYEQSVCIELVVIFPAS